MAKKKKAPAARATTDQGSIFDHFAAHNPNYLPPGFEPEPPAGKKPDLDEVLARIAALETDNKELRDQNARLSVPMAAAPAANPSGINGPRDVTLNLDNMPDPALNPVEYQRELQVRIASYTQAQVAAVRGELTSQVEQNNQADALWTKFQTAHPEWAEHEDLVGSVAVKIVNQAKARGVDTQKYMFGSTDLFIADVAKELGAKYGKLVADDEEEETPAAQAGATRSQDDDEGRTAGVFGGIASGGNPPSGTPKGGKPSGLIEDLQEIQQKMGLF